MKRKLLIIGCIIICITLFGCIGFDIYSKTKAKKSNVNNTQEKAIRKEEIKEKEVNKKVEEVISKTEEKKEIEKQAALENDNNLKEPIFEEPITTEAVIPKDIYVLKNTDGEINCYVDNALEYAWEYYDNDKKDWNEISNNRSIQLTGKMDELNRSLSTLIIKGELADDGLLVRCKVRLPDKEEDMVYQATFNVLDFSAEDIKEVNVSKEYKAEAGHYLSTLQLPVNIVKKDNSSIQVTGLNDLFFYIPKDISNDTEKKENGLTVETVRTTTLEKEYYLMDAGENEVLLRYRGANPAMNMETTIIGTDDVPPEVKIELGDYSISNIEVNKKIISVTINAKDNYSPLTKLMYAFKIKNKKISEYDFSKNNKIDIEVTQNSIWTAYVKDELGNVGTEDIEIIIVDKKAPTIESVELKNSDSGWLKENTISVIAKDGTALKYCYLCEADAIDSGWVDEFEYEINQNGLWKVKVKDAAGNESFKEITVSNVDSQAPNILSVLPKEKNKHEVVDTGTLEDRVNVTVKGATVKDDSMDSYSNKSFSDNSTAYSGSAISATDSRYNSYYVPNNSTTSKGEKGDRGVTGATGSIGATGAAGKDGSNSYLHIKYADSSTGNNMSDTPVDSSKYIGIYSGTSSVAPASASSYQWSQYKGSSSLLYIRYAESAEGANMTETPREESTYIGVCSSTDSNAPDNPNSYIWSKYKDNAAIIELQNKIEELQKQIDELKTPTP